jgi:hypothetical protein
MNIWPRSFERMSTEQQRDWALERLYDAKIEIGQLKNDGVREHNAQRAATLKRAFGLPPAEAYILLALYDARGKHISITQMNAVIPERTHLREDVLSDQLMKVYAAKLRNQHLRDPSAIITIEKFGYALSGLWIAKVAEALGEAIPKMAPWPMSKN